MNSKRIKLGKSKETRTVIDRLTQDLNVKIESNKTKKAKRSNSEMLRLRRNLNLLIAKDGRIGLCKTFKTGRAHTLYVSLDNKTHIELKRIASENVRSTTAHARQILLDAIKAAEITGTVDFSQTVKGIEALPLQQKLERS
jgi:hypothetical protein